MLAGAVVTQLAVPDSRDAKGESMSLEEFAVGEEHLRFLRSSGCNRRHTVDVDPWKTETGP